MFSDVLQADRDFRVQHQANSAALDKTESSHAMLRMINSAKDAWMYVQQIMSDGEELSVSTQGVYFLFF